MSEITNSNSKARPGDEYGGRAGQTCLVFGFQAGVFRVAGGDTGWTMSAFEKPQIIAHIQKSLNYTVFDCKWVPCSAKFVTMGNFARGTGVIQLYEIQHGDLKLLREVGAGS